MRNNECYAIFEPHCDGKSIVMELLNHLGEMLCVSLIQARRPDDSTLYLHASCAARGKGLSLSHTIKRPGLRLWLGSPCRLTETT